MLSTATASTAALSIWTIGHSACPFGRFVELLRDNAIERVIDVRIWPHSRHCPQFDGPVLASALAAVCIGYAHLPSLGGHRRPRADSRNTGWRNRSFRGYADYMETSEFAAGLAELLALAQDARAALMCAEVVPWRCHRSLIGDALVARGVRVLDILGPARVRAHALPPFARATGTRVEYPAIEGDPSG